MSLKDSATLDVGYPVYDTKFVNNKTLLVAGGGGEGNHGIPNKITAIKCSFKVADSKRRLQRFREITLPANEDSPQCLDTARIAGDDDSDVSVFVGCNQSSQLIKSMNINNNLRKYVFTKDEHLRFVDAVQLEEEITGDTNDYPKVVRLTPSNSAGVFMTSTVPSVLYGFNPETLELNFKYKQEAKAEVKDFHLSPHDNGSTVCYITANSISTISTTAGTAIASSTKNAALTKELEKYNLSKIRFIDDSNVLIAASLRKSTGAVLLQYSLKDQKITKQSVVSNKFNNIVAMDLVASKDLVAIAGNDFSLTILKLSNFKQLRSFKKLHPFAITSVAFSPNGTKLATGSAAQKLHVFRIPPTLAQGKSTIGTLFQYLITILLVALLGIGLL
ncbi:uncharacterized protein CANTADRAFT_87824 [Suhomyces tanzawaensis NRRL Y-17324]|uniref:Guanine nucleotide-exchange factor SEC12 n=1 Tax=Suhomyces tanzawaensis NRRL Y-17324 TaxID=984487 RepID=A0A1E4SQT8_9ASCO|nr:uncharacterized protein CANTADRAFT_87824 [Suhomyces tanzawaensis NRRL Y-17324]ODV81869.1 hypothetical protein CANTADRAFT_87824 [Suhomyces tanzawaensis NRRL Y-17324]